MVVPFESLGGDAASHEAMPTGVERVTALSPQTTRLTGDSEGMRRSLLGMIARARVVLICSRVCHARHRTWRVPRRLVGGRVNPTWLLEAESAGSGPADLAASEPDSLRVEVDAALVDMPTH